MKALMKQVKSGPNKGKYRVQLYGVNGGKISSGSKIWDDELEMRAHLRDNFPNFEIVDTTPDEEDEEDDELKAGDQDAAVTNASNQDAWLPKGDEKEDTEKEENDDNRTDTGDKE